MDFLRSQMFFIDQFLHILLVAKLGERRKENKKGEPPEKETSSSMMKDHW